MILKTVRGILNKLTSEKFEALMKRVDDLVIDSEKQLRAVVKLIVDKAVADHECSIYAEMCHHMRGVSGFKYTKLFICMIGYICTRSILTILIKSADGDVTEQGRLC